VPRIDRPAGDPSRPDLARVDARAPLPAAGDALRPPPGRADRLDPARSGPSVPFEARGRPANGGLHQLTLATAATPVKPEGPALDFARYRPGFNNRALLGAIVADLEQLMGQKIPWGYSNTLQALSQGGGFGLVPLKGGGFQVGERDLDQLLAPFDAPADRQAVASFAIAHEYFHAYLRHADLLARTDGAPASFRILQSSRFRKVAELQVDYLAARFLILRGLPAEAVLKMFETGDFPGNADYPSGAERAANVRRALEPGFAVELFQNDVLDCLAFLEELAGASTRP